MIRGVFLAVALCLAAPLSAEEGTSDGAAPGIRSVISEQMDAFRRDDVETAFGFAAPGIRNMFGTPETFGMMVEQGYPMVWRPAEVTFGALFEKDGRLWQRVTVTDRAGQLHMLDYDMRDIGGMWRIGGVRIVAEPGIAA